MSISRVSCLAFGLCLAVLRPAAAQAVNDVRLSVRIELARYLPGEPVTVLIDVQNVGQEILEYQPSGDGVNLTLVGVERRAVPDIGVCGISILEGRRIGGWIDHPPELAAGQMERADLKRLITRWHDCRRSSAVLALAQIGRPVDAGFLLAFRAERVYRCDP